MDKKLQIRTIRDVQGSVYNIYDIMYQTEFGLWISHSTHFNIEEALSYNPNIQIEDLSDID